MLLWIKRSPGLLSVLCACHGKYEPMVEGHCMPRNSSVSAVTKCFMLMAPWEQEHPLHYANALSITCIMLIFRCSALCKIVRSM